MVGGPRVRSDPANGQRCPWTFSSRGGPGYPSVQCAFKARAGGPRTPGAWRGPAARRPPLEARTIRGEVLPAQDTARPGERRDPRAGARRVQSGRRREQGPPTVDQVERAATRGRSTQPGSPVSLAKIASGPRAELDAQAVDLRPGEGLDLRAFGLRVEPASLPGCASSSPTGRSRLERLAERSDDAVSEPAGRVARQAATSAAIRSSSLSLRSPGAGTTSPA